MIRLTTEGSIGAMSDTSRSIPFEPKSVENYRKISIQLANPSTLRQLKSLFDREYSLEELLAWVHARLKFSQLTRLFKPT